MAIKRRELSDVQVPVSAPVFKPDPSAKLAGLSSKDAVFLAIGIYDEADPKKIPIDDLATLLRAPNERNEQMEKVYRDRIRNRNTAIRAFCVTCIGGSRKVRACSHVTCPLWAFRMGTNPFRKK